MVILGARIRAFGSPEVEELAPTGRLGVDSVRLSTKNTIDLPAIKWSERVIRLKAFEW
jgi:hypothetical protein